MLSAEEEGKKPWKDNNFLTHFCSQGTILVIDLFIIFESHNLCPITVRVNALERIEKMMCNSCVDMYFLVWMKYILTRNRNFVVYNVEIFLGLICETSVFFQYVIQWWVMKGSYMFLKNWYLYTARRWEIQFILAPGGAW